MQIANVKQRQILPRVGNQIWVRTPQNLASERASVFAELLLFKV